MSAKLLLLVIDKVTYLDEAVYGELENIRL
jgi:hypothetical protein